MVMRCTYSLNIKYLHHAKGIKETAEYDVPKTQKEGKTTEQKVRLA